MILDIDDNLDEVDTKDEAKGTTSDIDTRCLERDTSLYNTFVTLVLALILIESINISGL